VNSAEQRPKTPSVLACLAVLSVALACGRQGPTGTPPPAAPDTAPLASSCLDPAPRVVPRVPGPAAGAATGARFVRPLRKRKQSTILLWRVWLWRCLA
jgi:predicted small lipoprotein YifL